MLDETSFWHMKIKKCFATPSPDSRTPASTEMDVSGKYPVNYSNFQKFPFAEVTTVVQNVLEVWSRRRRVNNKFNIGTTETFKLNVLSNWVKTVTILQKQIREANF